MAVSEREGRKTSARMSDNKPVGQPRNVKLPFANDGSFLEMFKKRMEAMEKAKQPESDATSSKNNEDTNSSSNSASTSSTSDDERSSSQQCDDSKTPPIKPALQLQGKRKFLTGRMGGAARQLQLKKKKEEKLAAEQEKNSTKQQDDSKNTAWNAYLEEVKKYRETSCTEEVDRVRPLVK
ncbi:telomerase RNA component interacting RNase isoform X2 [Nematostella vectensis]|uniref:telomerase RNA component interacting RNase isoform X2 n=1 Tax=Nematostella vectensis TaxID=45351 RepID=UPI00207754E7|nr:telomerase RNA component interacting RNase isoform X2 [Nematostella vectensis]